MDVQTRELHEAATGIRRYAMPRVVVAAVAALVATVIGCSVLNGTASAGHTGYWFFQGNLPTTNPWVFGDPRYRVHPNDPASTALWFNRISYAPCAHRMNWLFIDVNGNWTEISGWPSNCDSSAAIVPSDQSPPINQGGCHNPHALDQVWANCRWGIGV